MSNFVLKYFDFHAKPEPIRLVFSIGHIKFIDDRFSFEDFPKRKAKGEFKFGQVPVLEVDGKSYAQTNAILRYTGKITGLYPQTYDEQLEIDEGIELVEDLFLKIADGYRAKGEEQEKKKEIRKPLVEVEIPKWLGYYEKKLQNSPSGYYGKKFSVADIYLYTLLRVIESGNFEFVDYDIKKHPKVYTMYKKISEIPEVKKWDDAHPINKL